ncbi:unnamed protein product [Linum tenue]|uniref:Uncharacterized protein n=1 Tax=Linum tenue TaxID=586396 RepID=A0AAV0PG07_9ROSI|nr:unnamed protein product [Linum tenue]
MPGPPIAYLVSVIHLQKLESKQEPPYKPQMAYSLHPYHIHVAVVYLQWLFIIFL